MLTIQKRDMVVEDEPALMLTPAIERTLQNVRLEELGRRMDEGVRTKQTIFLSLDDLRLLGCPLGLGALP